VIGLRALCVVSFVCCVGSPRSAQAQPMAAPEAAPPQPAPALPEGHPPAGGDPHAGMDGAPALSRRPLASAEPSHEVPIGSMRVRVLDAQERAVAGADVQVGTMSQDSGRTTLTQKTAADGSTTFDKLATGDKQAYRVNVLHEGAKFSSMPFRLPSDQGYDVVIRRLDTTRDDRDVVLYVGATSVELKDERLKVVQQVRVFNVGRKAYVFPEAGLLVKLPAGAMAFQADEVMTDQKLRERPGQGFLLQGSLPPGEITLTWGFDLPREGSTAELAFEMPWPTFAYRVLADAAEGMSLAVDEMPPPELQNDGGRRYFLTEVMRSPGEPPLRNVQIHLRGIPGPGALRYVASGLSLVIVALGVWFARRLGAVPVVQGLAAQQLSARRVELLARARQLEADHARGEVGPEFHARELGLIEEELAVLFFEEARAAAERPAASA
jgi:hypothetical protein